MLIALQIRARVIYDSLATTPRRFACSVLPHILSLSSPTLPDQTTPIEQGIPIGKLLSSVTVSRVIPEWGVMCRTDDGLEGFAHVSSSASSDCDLIGPVFRSATSRMTASMPYLRGLANTEPEPCIEPESSATLPSTASSYSASSKRCWTRYLCRLMSSKWDKS